MHMCTPTAAGGTRQRLNPDGAYSASLRRNAGIKEELEELEEDVVAALEHGREVVGRK